MSSQLSQTFEIHIDREELVENATESIAYIMAAIFTMNVFDAVATITWVTMGVATEANPLMDELLRVHPVMFVAVKLLLIGLGISLLWLRRQHWLSRAGVGGLFIIYSGLSLYHLSAIGFIV